MIKTGIKLQNPYHTNYTAWKVSISVFIPNTAKYGPEKTPYLEIFHAVLQFINSARFMASSWSNLVDNLPEGIHKIKCKYGHDNKKWQIRGINVKDCECCVKYKNLKDGLIE